MSVAEREGRALRRIVALLLALAQLAERAGSMPLPVRVMVLLVLRRAEAVAFAFAADIAWARPACCEHVWLSQFPDPFDDRAAGHYSPLAAARLSLSLRMLAMIVARWAVPAAAPVPVATSRRRVCWGAGWQGVGAIVAPDTS